MEEILFPEAEAAAGLAGHDGVPASGVITGIVLGMAASLLAVAADRSRAVWAGAAGAVAQAQALQRRAGALARSNSRSYDIARAALAGDALALGTPAQRDWAIGRAVAAAADPPLALAGCADDVAQLAHVIADHGAAEVRADVVVAAQLAAGAAASAAHLVQVNLVVGADEARTGQAQRHASSAAEAARAAAGG
ncbi:MAG TPA: cyclodeaminase/cyclohydrolase family protein [Solirubrobacteraceae bacterium]|nr:cyclodeaminase/cyclohydrolase family protein [Solirubrobacteraceae bacterium]